ncbi:hypothetical protein ABIC10_008843 [Bradyrhizobium sp. S3.2.12]
MGFLAAYSNPGAAPALRRNEKDKRYDRRSAGRVRPRQQGRPAAASPGQGPDKPASEAAVGPGCARGAPPRDRTSSTGAFAAATDRATQSPHRTQESRLILRARCRAGHTRAVSGAPRTPRAGFGRKGDCPSRGFQARHPDHSQLASYDPRILPAVRSAASVAQSSFRFRLPRCARTLLKRRGAWDPAWSG